jgi:hypothetical protein
MSVIVLADVIGLLLSLTVWGSLSRRALGGLGIRRTVSMGPSPLLCQRVREIATPAALDPGGT